MKLAPLAASILGCVWLLVNAISAPEDLSESIETDSLVERPQVQIMPSQVSDSTAEKNIPYQEDSTADFKVSIVPID